MKIKFKTDNKLALKHFAPIPSKKLMPEWYKNMPLEIEGSKIDDAKHMVQSESKTAFSIKGCVPVQDYLTNGYIIVAHADILITPEYIQETDSKTFWWKSQGTSVQFHAHSQCPVKMHGYSNQYVKFLNSWAIETPKGYSCYFYQPEFFMENRYQLFPAIVDTDGYNIQPVNFPGVIISDKSFTIKAGEPIMAVFPFKRENWKSEISYIEEKDKDDGNLFHSKLFRAYKDLFWNKKSYD